MKRLTPLLLTLLLSVATTALGHATLVLGTLTSEPRTPAPGEPFALTVELEDPTQIPIEDAWVVAEFRPEGAGEDAAPVSARFEESDIAGIYKTTLTLPEPGSYTLLLRDQTYRQEEALAEPIPFAVGSGENPESVDFLSPPTATTQSVWVWLLWLIGLPIVAAIAVTILVLTRGKSKGNDNPQKA